MPEALGRIAELAALVDVPIQVDGGVGEENVTARPGRRARRCSSPAARSSRTPTRPPPTAASRAAA